MCFLHFSLRNTLTNVCILRPFDSSTIIIPQIMIKHTSAVSGDLPDYLRSSFELKNPVQPRKTPAKGRKAVLGQVSSDAPASFLLRYVRPSSPAARKAAFRSMHREDRLIQDLKCSKYQEFARFRYEDFSGEGPVVDYGTLALSTGADLLKGNGAGARAKLPYYQAYAKAVEKRQFPVKQGVFSYRSRQKAAGRADGSLLRSLRSASTFRGKSQASTSNSREESSSPKNSLALNSSLRASQSCLRSRSVRAVLGSSSNLRLPKCPPTLTASPYTCQEIDHFDLLLRTDPTFHPVTKKSLALT